MIKSIYLKNWRSHSESFVSFDYGTNLLIGRMGGGKTSIVDGICFALFGTCPSLQQRRASLNDLIRNRPEPQDYSEVSLKFTFGNDEYEVSRKIVKNGRNSAQLKKNDKIIVSSPERVKEYIEQLLELDYDLFTRAIYSEQNRIDYFLTLKKGERKEQIDELLGLSKFEQLRQNITKLINRLNDILYDKKYILDSINTEEILEEINRLKKEEREIEDRISKLTNDKNYNEKILNNKQEELEILEKIKEEYEQAKNKLNGINRSIEII
jgi:exonuclease SbcC